MTLALALLGVLLTVAPAAAQAITFPITLTDYWPNTAAMDAGWRLEVVGGGPDDFGRFVRTGPATFAWKERPSECIQDHFVITAYDQVDLGRDDPRIVGGVFHTHTVSTCPGNHYRQYFGPWRQVGPPTWEPGFGSLSTPIRSHTIYAGDNGEWLSTFKVRDGNRWFDTELTPDGIHTIWYDTGADESDEAFGLLETWLSIVPFCDGSAGGAPGWRRVRQFILLNGNVHSDVDFRFCWRKP